MAECGAKPMKCRGTSYLGLHESACYLRCRAVVHEVCEWGDVLPVAVVIEVVSIPSRRLQLLTIPALIALYPTLHGH
jgi:hypothetical protein